MGTNTICLKADNLRKTFNDFVAVESLSIEIEKEKYSDYSDLTVQVKQLQ